MNRDIEYLKHIRESSELVLQWMQGVSLEDFLADMKLVDAVIRRLEIIGEASTRIGSTFKSKFPEITWREMKAMRNKLIHEYDRVNLRASTVQEDLPNLRDQVVAVLDKQSR